jgi:thiol-disulfide isomerase/thioredoxin
MPRTNLPMPPVASSHGPAAREIGWTTLDGRRSKLADYRGQVVVLDLYATYCPPCLKEIPHLVDIQRQFRSQGLSVIGLNAGGPEDQAKVPEYVERLGIQYQLGNPDDELVEMLSAGDTSIPKTFVFDRQGRLVERFVGFDDEIKTGLDSAIQAALGSKAD